VQWILALASAISLSQWDQLTITKSVYPLMVENHFVDSSPRFLEGVSIRDDASNHDLIGPASNAVNISLIKGCAKRNRGSAASRWANHGFSNLSDWFALNVRKGNLLNVGHGVATLYRDKGSAVVGRCLAVIVESNVGRWAPSHQNIRNIGPLNRYVSAQRLFVGFALLREHSLGVAGRLERFYKRQNQENYAYAGEPGDVSGPVGHPPLGDKVKFFRTIALGIGLIMLGAGWYVGLSASRKGDLAICLTGYGVCLVGNSIFWWQFLADW